MTLLQKDIVRQIFRNRTKKQAVLLGIHTMFQSQWGIAIVHANVS